MGRYAVLCFKYSTQQMKYIILNVQVNIYFTITCVGNELILDDKYSVPDLRQQ